MRAAEVTLMSMSLPVWVVTLKASCMVQLMRDMDAMTVELNPRTCLQIACWSLLMSGAAMRAVSRRQARLSDSRRSGVADQMALHHRRMGPAVQP